ncbi:MAG: hypothetical protein RR758_03125 [Burkholderiaceae bacterium]
MNIMSNIQSIEDAAARQKVAGRLRALRFDNYRRHRWDAIHSARQAQMTWAEIGDALGIMATAASRMYRTDAPQADEG